MKKAQQRDQVRVSLSSHRSSLAPPRHVLSEPRLLPALLPVASGSTSFLRFLGERNASSFVRTTRGFSGHLNGQNPHSHQTRPDSASCSSNWRNLEARGNHTRLAVPTP